MSVFWIWLFANLMIDLLKLFGLLTGLPTTLLGLTVLAWGNSIGDYIANTSIAKKGFIEMALTGSFSSPLFNMLLGLGISTLKSNILIEDKGNSIRFTFNDPHCVVPTTLIVGGLISITYSIIMTIFINNYKITKSQAKT